MRSQVAVAAACDTFRIRGTMWTCTSSSNSNEEDGKEDGKDDDEDEDEDEDEDDDEEDEDGNISQTE